VEFSTTSTAKIGFVRSIPYTVPSASQSGQSTQEQNLMAISVERWIVLIVLLLGISCGRAGSRQTQTSSGLEPILGAVDSPARGATLRGSQAIGGWALAESGVDRVAIYIDKQFIAFAALGGSRPDIAKSSFASFPNSANCGWGAVIDFSQMLEGEHELVLQVKTKAGHLHDFPAVPFTIVR
jgi:hypothetical protein